MTRPSSSHRGRLRTKVPDSIASALRDQIMSGDMVVDDKLPAESRLMGQFGASRGSVREALKSLEVQGLIYTVPGPGGGARVRAVDEERVFEFMRNFFHFRQVSALQMYEVRQLVEPATAVGAMGVLTPMDFEALERTQTVLAHGDGLTHWAAHRSAELEFHEILANACPNPLLAMVARFVNVVLRASAESSYPSSSAEEAEEEKRFGCTNLEAHEQLLIALRAGQADRVHALMLAHIESAKRFVLPIDERARRTASRPT